MVFPSRFKMAPYCLLMFRWCSGMECCKKRDGLLLHDQGLAMHHRHGQKYPASQWKRLLPAPGNAFSGQGAGAVVAAEGGRLATEHVACELVQQQYQGQPVKRLSFPVRQTALHGFTYQATKGLVDLPVQCGASSKPQVAATVAGPAQTESISEPEFEDPLRRGKAGCNHRRLCQGRQMLKLKARFDSAGSRSSKMGVLASRTGTSDWPAKADSPASSEITCPDWPITTLPSRTIR